MEDQKKVRKKFVKPSGSILNIPFPMNLTKELFKVRQRKKVTLQTHMYKSIRRFKLATSREIEKLEYIAPIPHPAKSSEFKGFCEKGSSTEMSIILENRIRKTIQARGLEEYQAIVLAELIQQAKEEYSKVVHYASMNLKIKNCYPDFTCTVLPYKNVGRTSRYQEYLLKRKHFQFKWILHYPIVRRIVKECIVSLPYELFQLKLDSVLDLSEFQSALKEKVKSASVSVHEFYNNILLLVDEEQSKQRKRIYTANYLNASTGLISVHLSRAIAHTILHTVAFTSSKQNEPYLNLNATFYKGLLLEPTAEEVISAYDTFIEDIINIGTKINVLQQRDRRSYKTTYMPLCLTQEFIYDCKRQITSNIHELYKPILEYTNNISAEFAEVYPNIHSETFYDSISDIILENGYVKINYYKDYLSKAAYIPHNEYFKLGKVSLVSYKQILEEGLKKNIDDIFQRLSLQHLWEVTNLCETFQLIHTRATQQPLTTEELVETGKFMTWIKKEHFEELSARVESSLSSLCKIIDLGELSEEHIELNSAVVHWLDKSQPIIDQYFSDFEQLKYDAEEILQKNIEDVAVSIKDVYPLLVILDNMDDITRVRSYLKSITLHMAIIKEVEGQILWINNEEVCLSFPKSAYPEFEHLKTYVYPFYHLLKLCLDVQRNLSVWQDGQFENLDHETTKSSVDKIYEELKKLYKNYREKLRKAQDENLPVRFRGTVDDPDILNWPAPLKLCGTAMRLVDDFKPSVEIMKIICNKALRKRHWKAMSEIAQVDITPNAGSTLRKMMKVDFESHLKDYEIISSGATKEKQLIDSLRSLRQQWETIKFTIRLYKQARILVHLEDIKSIIDEHFIKLVNMRGSVFVKPHEVEVKNFYSKILQMDQTVDKWNQLQSQFLRLFPIFSTGHLDTIVLIEADLFKKIQNIYNAFMDTIAEVQTVIKVVDTTNILENISSCLTDLEIIHSGVVTYLETVRLSFPRFYFLADDELLEIVSRKEPMISQNFLKKIFQGINFLRIDNSHILGMESKFSEYLNFINPIDLTCEKKIEEVCTQIEKEMVESLKYFIGECFKVYKRSDLKDVVTKFPQQALTIISQVYWTESLENSLLLTRNIKLRLYYQKLQDDLDYKVELMNDKDRTNLDKLKIRSLITSDLNYRHLVKKILDSRVVNKNQFDWQAHTKYYLQKGLCTVQLMNITQNYLYEYLANPEPIVLTPLTDRCYRTLINAYYLRFNGLVQGPNDSGKSQTIRALAGTLGVFFISFCCLPEMDSSTVSRLLKGNSLCGSWICLESLDALKAEVMSVVFQDMYSILLGKNSSGKQTVGGTSIKVNPTCFVCSTITSRKTELMPKNLRVLFRTVTMAVPDIDRIVEVTLYSIGFKNALALSKKLFCLYGVIKDIFPARKHYQFGAKLLKNALFNCVDIRDKNPNASENFVLFVSLRATILPMLIEDDVLILDDLLREFFPDVDVLDGGNDVIKEYVVCRCKSNNLQFTEKLYTKTMEVYNALNQVRGLILVGKTFTAKTTIIDICNYVFNKLDYKNVLRCIVNPGSLDYEVLYGKFDKTSNVWFDGVITKILREFSNEHKEHRKWLIFDGNLDSSYMENVTTILEEDTFYLDSGEVLTLNGSTSVIFETENLNGLSPSIISRCRIAYVGPSTLTWDAIVKSWIESSSSQWFEGHQEQVLDLLNWMIPPCLIFIETNCDQLCHPNPMNLVKSTIQLVQMILDDAFLSIARKEEDIKNLWTWIQATLIQAGIMGLGSILTTDSRYKFDEFYRQLWKGQNIPYPESFEKLEVGLPADGLIFDYHFIYKQRGIWKLYQDLLKNEKVIESTYMYEFLVPTVDSLRYHFLLNLNINNKHPTLLVGPSCTGKSLLIEDILINRLDKNIYEASHINFSTNITSRQLQTYILSKLNKRKTGCFTPPSNKHLLLFIDNLNMVSVDENGTSRGLELLRQYMDHNSWYDLTHSYPISLEKVNFITAMRPMGSRKLSQRFLRHFNIFSINEFNGDTISRIYTTILLHIWKKGGFPSDITMIISQIVSATVRIYNSMTSKCKPTINQCYYVFNLNTFTKVIKGCSRLKKESYDANKKVHLKLWAHEVLREFGDRLNDINRSWLLDNVKETIKEEFNEEEEDTSIDYTLMFGAIPDRELQVDNRRYEQIVDQKNLVDVVSECLKHYNYYNKEKMDLIFFTCAVENLTKICRIISTSPSNVLLLGLRGSGRQSLSKLASYIYNQKLFQPKITQNYSIKEWNRDLKLVLRESGGLEKECMLLISEEQLIDECFLQNIDHLLMNGEIPDFYDADERQEILELARLAAQGGNKNLDISASDVFLYFNKRCKENIHLILCLNYNDSLRRRIRKHPSLMNCHVIWCEEWPDQSLQIIARTRMDNLTLEEELKENVVDALVYFHRQSQNRAEEVAATSKLQVHIMSSAFLHSIKLFTSLITKKQFEINQKKKRYSQGLAKLSYAANQIISMQESLANYQPQLEAMTQKAFDMSAQISLETAQVEKASDLVRRDETIACEQAAVAQILKSECEAELAQAIPILEDAISALNTLKPSDITLVKSMKNPPDAIKLVMAAVCVIKDVRPERLPDPSTGRKIIDYWGPSKRILGDMNFLQSLKDFDKDNIRDELIIKIRKEYLPHKDFKPQVVAKASSAAEGLCKWIIAMNMYDMVAKEVAPKKEKLEKAENEYAGTMTVLNEKKEEVARLEEKLATLNDQLAEAKQKQVKLQKEVDYCNRKLRSAQKLIGSLSGERIRWTETLENLEKHYALLVGDILISCGVIAYLPPFKETDRFNIINDWLGTVKTKSIPCKEDFDLVTILANETQFDTLRIGLPNDNFFVANIVIKEFSQYYTIFIDPQYQASAWVRQIEKRNNLTIIEFCQDDYLTILKNCIISGKPVLIHKIKEYIPPCLNNLLAKKVYGENEELSVEINEEYLKLNENFRIYMVSNLDFPVFVPAVYKMLTVINFSLTRKGLGDRLLEIVSEVEKPELKKLKKDLDFRKSTNKYELLQLEEKILTTLCESDSDILEDEASIRILDQSKDLAKVVRSKQEETKLLENTINEFRINYSPVADYAAFLFYCVDDLKNLNIIYQFSLDWHTELYFKSILKSKRSKVVNERCDYIKSCFTFDIFYYVTLSLLETDKLTFLFILTVKLMIFLNKINKEQLIFFLKGRSVTSNAEVWREDEVLNELRQFEELFECDGLTDHFTNHMSSWKTFLGRRNVGLDDFPFPWNDRLDHFKKLVIIKVFRKDQLFKNIKPFVGVELGEKFIQTQHYNLLDIYNESYSLSPVLIFETPGVNLMKALKNLAATKKILNKFKWLSLASNQTGIADNLIEEAKKQGNFLFFQNCHLVPDWLRVLEQRIMEMDIDNTHEDFRLWLATSVTCNIPVEVLKISIKVVDERPNGLKENLIRLYKKEPLCDSSFYSRCPGKQKIFARLLYGVTFFHCLLEEKRKFGAFSWNFPYLFDEEDFSIVLQQLQSIVNEDNFSTEYLVELKYIIGDCFYSGKLNNEWDTRLVSVLLDDCLNSHLYKSRSYCFNNLKEYGLPAKNDYKDYLSYIYSLPNHDNPQLYGLNEFSLAFNEAKECEDLMAVSLFLLEDQCKKDVIEDDSCLLTSINEILNLLPSKLDTVAKFECHVISNEVKRYNHLLDVINQSLVNLRTAINGDLEFSFNLEDISRSILRKSFPKEWLKYSYPHQLNLPRFVRNFCQRVQYFKNSRNVTNRFWLPGFFFPQALLCKVTVDISKKYSVALEELVLEYDVLNDFNTDVDKIIIEGLFSHGAKWDKDRRILIEVLSTLYESFPPILFHKNVSLEKKRYKCPVYQTENTLNYDEFIFGSRHFITSVLLPTEVDPNCWIKRGVKLVCQVSEENADIR